MVFKGHSLPHFHRNHYTKLFWGKNVDIIQDSSGINKGGSKTE